MNTYLLKFCGAYQVEAENEEEARKVFARENAGTITESIEITEINSVYKQALN